MERIVFDAAIEDLEKVTTPLTTDQRDVYYEHLKKWPTNYIEKCVKTLIQTYRAKRFPSIPVFRRVLDHIEVKEQTPSAASEYDKFACPACNDLGWWVEYKIEDGWGLEVGLAQTPHNVVAFCQCNHGVRKREGIAAYNRIMKRVEEKRSERKNEPFESVFEEEK